MSRLRSVSNTLYAIHGRALIRTSHKDPGKLAIWLVNAPTPEEARAIWDARDTNLDFTFESIQPHAKTCVRIF